MSGFEILGIITKEHPEKIIGEAKYKSLTKGFDSHKYYESLKVLKENTVFSINNNYKIEYDGEKKISIQEVNTPFDLYSSGSPKIQVNAIVGKNGSGKSTLSEILYLMLYNIAVDKELIHDQFDDLIKEFKGFLNAILLLKNNQEIVCIDFENLNYFEYEHSKKEDSNNVRYFKIPFLDGNCNFQFTELKSTAFRVEDLFYMISLNYSLYGLNEKKMGSWIKHIFHKNDMYKTPIVINPYREEGNINVKTEDTQNTARAISNLSRRSTGGEATTLSPDYDFHQINVFYNRNQRKRAYLAQPLKEYMEKNMRLKSERLQEKDIIDFKSLYDPFVYFNTLRKESEEPDPFMSVQLVFPIATPFDTNPLEVHKIASILLYNSSEAFKIIHSYFYNLRNEEDLFEILKNLNVSDSTSILVDLFAYFICKLYRIGINYPEEYGQLLNEDRNGFSEGKQFEEAIMHALTSNSHVCFKLKRTYFFLNYSKGKESTNFVFENDKNGTAAWILRDLTLTRSEVLDYRNPLKVNAVKPEYSNKNFYTLDEHFFLVNDIIWRIPPPVFETEVIVNKTNQESHKQNLKDLSSGETQFIYTLQTILYHIININSNINEDKNEGYKNVVVLLDEIELYHHPEYQRVFLATLIKQINELKLDVENIQIIALTHSPFILSDIPSVNILRLENGNPSYEEFNQTFSANILDMFLSNFFMSSTIGAFAEKKISELINFQNVVHSAKSKEQLEEVRVLYLEEKKKKFYTVLNLIGDDVIKGILENNLIHIEEKLGVGKYIDARIKALEAEIDRLNNNSRNA